MTLSLYIHIPFCSSKCAYCDFYSVPLKKTDSYNLQKKLIDALLIETETRLSVLEKVSLQTIFIGGGTPSILNPDLLSDFLIRLGKITAGLCKNNIEFTTEANIGSCTEDFLDAASSGGINRLSLGVQSFDTSNLEQLGRKCGTADIFDSAAEIRSSWPHSFSIDLISGLNRNYIEDLEKAVRLNPDHISAYQLTVEDGTPLHADITAGKKKRPSDTLQSSAIRGTCSFLKKSGYSRYEISNYSRPGMESRHNTRYWQMQSYLGIGPSAVSSFYDQAPITRTENIRDVIKYIDAISKGDNDDLRSTEILSDFDFLVEHYLMGYRMTAGIDETIFQERFGKHSSFYIPETIAGWQRKGLFCRSRSALTSRGLMFLDRMLTDVYDELSSNKNP